MEYLMVIWFLIFPFFAMSLYYYTYKKEVDEEIYQMRKAYEINMVEMKLRLESYNLKLESIDNERKYYHDLKKHLEVIESLYASGNKEKATQYADELLEKKPSSDYYISNDLLNIILCDFKEKCDKNKITLDTKINRRMTLSDINDIDITIIFSNLFQNALEAVNKANQKKINVEINQVDQFLVTVVRNTFKDDEKNSSLISTKLGHKGYGINNIVETVEKYNGIYSIEKEGMYFKFQIVLPI